MIGKTIHSKLKAEVAATLAVGLVILVVTGAQAKDSAHRQNTDPVHGTGSSHDPIVYHPVHGTGSSHNPIINPTVRDHRGDNAPPEAPPQCGSFGFGDCGGKLGYSKNKNPVVRDHRNDPVPCLGNLC